MLIHGINGVFDMLISFTTSVGEIAPIGNRITGLGNDWWRRVLLDAVCLALIVIVIGQSFHILMGISIDKLYLNKTRTCNTVTKQIYM
jgi:hypothetical protein